MAAGDHNALYEKLVPATEICRQQTISNVQEE
jgi:hypothetical protein